MEIIETKREDTVVSYEEWREFFKKRNQNSTEHGNFVYDLDTADFIREVVETYISEPVGYYKEQLLEAHTVKIDSIEDLVAFKNALIASGKKIALYAIQLYYPFPIYYDIDTKTFEMVPLGDNARMSSGYWFIRYAEV